MSWARLDDSFYDHPKMVGLSPEAGWLWARSLAYAARHETDGYLREDSVRNLSGLHPDSVFKELEESGLWERNGAGWRIHDFLDFNPSKASIRDRRERDRARKAHSNA